ncbi:MAG: alpha/beta hydrolase [Candidatus Thorarchaeota archaeon]
MKYTENTFLGLKNHKIYYQSWIPEDPKAIIQIVHGGVEHVGRYRHLVDYVTSSGFAVYGNDHRGHGKSEGRRNHIKSFDEYVEDCYKLTELIKKEQKGKPIFLIGHSMGSLIGQRYAIKYQKELKGLVLSGSGTRVPLPKPLELLARVMGVIWPTFMGPAGIIPEELSSDPDSVKDYTNDPLINYKKATTSYGLAFIKHYPEIKNKIETIKIPVLIQKGELDKLVIGIEELIEDLKNAKLTVKIYPGGWHEMYTETKEKREKAFSDLVQWMNKLL